MGSFESGFKWFLVIPFITLGLLGTGFGGWNAFQTFSMISECRQVKGTVIGLVKSSDHKPPVSRQSTGFRSGNRNPTNGVYPEVEYQVDGTNYRIRGHVASSPPAYEVGDMVTIRFRTETPADGQIHSFMENWLVTLMSGGVGLVFLLVGYGMALPKKPEIRA